MLLPIATAVTEAAQVRHSGLLLKEEKPSKTVAQAAELLEVLRSRGILWGAAGGVVIGLGALAVAICITVKVIPWPADSAYVLYIAGGISTAGGVFVLLVRVLVSRRQAQYRGPAERAPEKTVLGPEQINSEVREVINRVEIPGPPRQVIRRVTVSVPPGPVVRREVEVRGPPRIVIRKEAGTPPSDSGFIKKSELRARGWYEVQEPPAPFDY